MLKIGLVGGLSWISTEVYYRRLNLLARQMRGGHHTLDLVLESIDEGRFLQVQAEQGDAACGRLVCDAVGNLLASGAQVVALCANGIHRFTDSIEQRYGIKILSIADAVAEYAHQSNIRRLGIVGVAGTMAGRFYPDALSVYGIESLSPPLPQQSGIHEAIVGEMVLGRFTDTARETVASAIAQMDAGAVVLACTELPILFGLAGESGILNGKMLLSSTELHCRAIIRSAAGNQSAV